MLDNASRFKVFWRVLLPMTLPAQATLGIYTFLHAWNDYWWPLISGTNERMYTVTVGIASTQMNFAESAGLGFLMAQAMFAALPILIVYLFFQKYIVRAASVRREHEQRVVQQRHALSCRGVCCRLRCLRRRPNEIVVQRFFGTCEAKYGSHTDVASAETECGIITTLLNKFRAENPDIRVRVSHGRLAGLQPAGCADRHGRSRRTS